MPLQVFVEFFHEIACFELEKKLYVVTEQDIILFPNVPYFFPKYIVVTDRVLEIGFSGNPESAEK